MLQRGSPRMWAIGDGSHRDAQSIALMHAWHSAHTHRTQGMLYRPSLRGKPTWLVAAGQHAIKAALPLKARYQAKLVGILHPGEYVAHCDAVILPAHEPAFPHPHLWRCTGLLTPYTAHHTAHHTAQAAKHYGDKQIKAQIKALPSPMHLLLLGGVHVGGTLIEADIAQMLEHARQAGAASIAISRSKRTPTGLLEYASNLLGNMPHFLYHFNKGRNMPNPYDLLLHQADHVWVTADSLRMVAEATHSHAVVSLYQPHTLAPIYQKAAELATQHSTQPFPLNEAKRAAEWLKKYCGRHD